MIESLESLSPLERSEAETIAHAREFGIKRVCQACNARYYDLNKTPVLCPACGVEHDPEATLSRRRSRIADEGIKKEKSLTGGDEVAEAVVDLPDVELEEEEQFDKTVDETTLLDDDDDNSILPEVIIPDDDET